MFDDGDRTCASALAGASRVLFSHRHRASYLPGAPEIPLWVAAERGPGGLRVAAAPAAEAAPPVDTGQDVAAFARRFGVPLIDLGGALRLQPVTVPKPWGREIWFTGIEARGQAQVGGEGGVMPLPWLLSIASREVLGEVSGALNLLKILDPLPDPVYGDLYFELHEEKREVYVVTGVDQRSWPDGLGAIRYGFDPRVRGRYPSDDAFRAAYLARVRDYEEVRRRIQELEEGWRMQEGYGPRDPVPATTLRRWRAALSPELRRREVARRRDMERFTLLRRIRVGDVVRVPLLLPHALQHGVRTVEFQTPVYERRILSFAQKVLTQDHWDTELAVARMHLVPPSDPGFPVVREQPGVTREQIVEFDDFRVDRIALDPGARWELALRGRYALAMSVSGAPRVAGQRLAEESAMLLPAAAGRVQLRAGSDPALLLIARPRGG
jgi:hypothetical protein